jgi:ferredoxin/flavodoxin---NADP+ reductase
MFQIIGKQNLSASIKRIDIKAENLVARFKPGQFVAVMVDRFARSIPFNVLDVDWRRKCVSIVCEERDADTLKIGALRINDEIFSIRGPFGAGCPIVKEGAIVCLGEGLGLSSLVMLCRSLKQVGNKVIGIAGFESRKNSILENQLRLYCTKFFVMYKDGMHERKGDVLMPLKKVLQEEPVTRMYVDVGMRTLEDVRAIAEEKKVPVLANLLAVVAERGAFLDTGHVMMNGKKYYPAVDGIVVDLAAFNVKELMRSVASAQEYSACRRSEQEQSARSSVSARLKKFIWG